MVVRIAGLLLLLFCCGCSTIKNVYHAVVPVPKPEPTVVSLQIHAAVGMNPNSHNEASPLSLTFYQLAKPDHFTQSDFLLLFENDEKQLGAELVSRRQLPAVIPGESYTYSFVLDSKTKFVGLLAAFSRYQQGVNRQVHAIELHKNNNLSLMVEGNRILLASDE
ncbi:type VI secretion system lipoprotein TssJ [Spongorhabdus nitratireducens]